MIIDFSISNYLSIKDEISLSFLSNTKLKPNESKIALIENGKYKLYPFSAIYGPNASGKSNIIKALSDFINFIVNSHHFDIDKPINAYKPFRLDKENLSLPIGFEIEFFTDNKRYNYSIEFNKNEVFKEELHFYPEGRKAILFVREKNKEIKYGNYFTGEKKSLETFLLPNRLLLSIVANSTNEVLKPVYRFFRDDIDIHVRMDSSSSGIHSTTIELRERGEDFKVLLKQILKAADLSVQDVKLVEDKQVMEKLRLPEDIPEEIRQQIVNDFRFRPFLGHAVYNKGEITNDVEYFNLEYEESTGTIKMYDIAGEVLNALRYGKVLIIDEFNSGLHPLLNKLVVDLFMDKNINKKNAQLLISTHDTCILDLQTLKREQIWFTDKTNYSSTELFSLDEFDKNLVRDNSKYAKLYLDGRFKGVPAPNLEDLLKGLI